MVRAVQFTGDAGILGFGSDILLVTLKKPAAAENEGFELALLALDVSQHTAYS